MALESDRNEDLLAEVNEVDAAESAELLEETPTSNDEYIEYLGDPNSEYGTDFLTSHTLSKGDPAWKRLGVQVTKDLTWERDEFGPEVGHKGNRLLLPVTDLKPEVAAALVKLPGFKRVTVAE